MKHVLARRRLRRTIRIVAVLVAGSAALAATYLVATPTGRYIARAAWEEAKILARRRSIVELVADNRTPAPVRAKLQLVLDARRFSESALGLRPAESFTTYTQLDRDTLVLVLSGAYRDRLERRTWWFPVVGRVPYKGFFDFEAARRASRGLAQDGFDVDLRPASAFSTLGFFNDPLLSTTLRQDSMTLANTVIHEITHSTFFARGQAVFNESFANFVGARGAELFFRSRGQEGAARLVDARWRDQKILGRFWADLHRSLDSAFKAHPGDALRAQRLALRDSMFSSARRQLVGLAPNLRTVSADALERVRLDNAALLARRVYMTDLEAFDRVFARESRDLRATVRRVIDIAERRPSDPFGGLHDYAGPPDARSGAGAMLTEPGSK